MYVHYVPQVSQQLYAEDITTIRNIRREIPPASSISQRYRESLSMNQPESSERRSIANGG